MAFPLNTGYPAYSGTVIPTLWAKKMLERFYDASVVPMISQTDYEGEIRNQGDKVIINQVPTININAYTMGQQLTLQYPGSSTVTLNIDQGLSWSFALDDVADAQAMTNLMTPWAENASEELKISVDTDVLSFIKTLADASNSGAAAGRISGAINLGVTGTPVQITSGNVLNFIISMGQVLDEQNIPETDRKLVIPAWMAALLKQSNLQQASITGDAVSIVRNGKIGMVDRFEVYVSNLLPTATDTSTGTPKCWYVYAIHPRALTFASQLTRTETIRSELTFATIMRGLMVYGRQVVLPKAFSVGYVKQ